MRSLAAAALAVVALSACPAPAPSNACNTDADCKNGDRCVDGTCSANECTPATFCKDVDGDGFGDPHASNDGCVETGAPAGFVADCSDCDDADRNVHPGATEIVADGVDQDCDGKDLCYVDADGDGHGALSGATVVGASSDCDAPGAHTSTLADDCDDADPNVHPGADEIPADGVDQDCDGNDACYVDEDGDGFGRDAPPFGLVPFDAGTCASVASTPGSGIAAAGGDCDDGDASVHPGAAEIVNDGIDQDCDGVDSCFVDADGDGHGASSGETAPGTSLDCAADIGPAGNSGVSNVDDDCDDTDADVHPGAVEIPADGIDEDCDGVELCFVDRDGDGVGTAQTIEAPQDPTCTTFGLSRASNDCDDDNALIFPGAGEIVNDGIDQDCDGKDACFQDLDGDTFGSNVVVPGPSLHCSDGVGHGVTTNSADCDDTNAKAHPGAAEIPADGVDEDCDGHELCFVDVDGDGLGDPTTAPVVSSNISCIGPGIASNDDDCDDNVPGGPGQACSDGQACTAVDVCGPHGSCVGFDEGACGCAPDCTTQSGACCDVVCGSAGACPACVGRQCVLDCGGSAPCDDLCSDGASCDAVGSTNATASVTCDDSACRDAMSVTGDHSASCVDAAACFFDAAHAGGTFAIDCDHAQCNGDVSCAGSMTVTCTHGASCDVACDSDGSCDASADASSSLLLTCTRAGGGCSASCATPAISCGNGVFACNRACP